jgi:hypothetical protein
MKFITKVELFSKNKQHPLSRYFWSGDFLVSEHAPTFADYQKSQEVT